MTTPASGAEFTLDFMNPDRLRDSAEAVIRFANEIAPDRQSKDFWHAIRELQHRDFPVEPPSATPTAVFYEGEGDVVSAAVGALMGGVAAGEFASPYAADVRQTILETFRRTLQRFADRFPQTYPAFCKIIRHVIFARRDGYSGGTVSSRIGLIWLAPESHWSDETWLENLVHEFVHNALFVEDMVHRILVAGGDRLDQADAQATSAIRQVKRGYDKSFHSAFVSFAIVEMYRKIARDDLADPFIAPLLVCLEDLIAKQHFATARGQQMMFELATAVLPLYDHRRILQSAAE